MSHTLLADAHPALVVVTPSLLSPRLRKAGAKNVLPALAFNGGAWQVIQTAQVGTLDISTGTGGWSTQLEG